MRIIWFILTVLPLTFFSISNSSTSDKNEHTVAMQFVKLVQKRYYFIRRLEKPIKVLFYIHKKLRIDKDVSFFSALLHHHESFNKKIIVEPGTALLFQNDRVRECMKRIEQSQEIDALEDLWSDFLSYKYIETDSFVQETLKAIMLLYKNLLLQITILKQQKARGVIHVVEIDELLNDKDSEIHDSFSCILNLLSSASEKKDFIINNTLTLYLMRRMHKSMDVLNVFRKFVQLDDFWQCLLVTKKNGTINFKHESIAQCIEQLIETKSYEPLFSLWRKFSAFSYTDDVLFLKEFVSLQYIVYSRIIYCMKTSNRKAPTIEEIIELYDAVAGLPMPDALNSLDQLVEELEVLMEKYELDSRMSWTSWFKKYWWVPPVAITSFYLNFIWLKKALRTA